MNINKHPYNKNNIIYNFLFHPFHQEKTRVLAVITNLFMTVVTVGFWQIPFWCVNRLDNRDVVVWEEKLKSDSPKNKKRKVNDLMVKGSLLKNNKQEKVKLIVPEGFSLGKIQKESTKQVDYSSKSAFEKIEQLDSSGQNLGIVLGRGANQTLPKKEGITFVSLDNGNITDNKVSADRIHLKRNFNDRFNKLNKFTSIIVDRNVRKFFNLDKRTESKVLEIVKPLLKDDLNSSVMFELSIGLRRPLEHGQILESIFGDGHVPILLGDIGRDEKKRAKIDKLFTKITVERDIHYYKKFFKKVEFVEEGVAAYPSRYPEIDSISYFELKEPKKTFFKGNWLKNDLKVQDTNAYKEMDKEERQMMDTIMKDFNLKSR